MQTRTVEGKLKDGTPYDRLVWVDDQPDAPDEEVAYTETCGRCGGDGRIRHYAHVDGGVCFECGGSPRTTKVTHALRRKREQAYVESMNRRTRADIKRLAARDKFLSELADETGIPLENLKEYQNGHHFISDMIHKQVRYGLTNRQYDALLKAIADHHDYLTREADRVANLSKVPELPQGKQTFPVKIVRIKETTNNFSYHGETVLKATYAILDSDGNETGQKVFGTLFKSISDSRKDDVIVLTGTVTRSDDHTFGFIKRPTVKKGD